MWLAEQKTWQLLRAGGELVESKQESVDDEGNRVITHTVRDAEGNIASQSQTFFHQFPWGEEKIKEVIDPSGAALTTTKSYYDDASSMGSYAKIKKVVNQDGSWRSYTYDDKRRTIQVMSTYLDSGTEATVEQAQVVQYEYHSLEPADTESPRFFKKPRTTTQYIQGKIVSKTFHSYRGDGVEWQREEITEQCATANCEYGSPENLRTVSTYYPTNYFDSAQHWVGPR